MIVGESWPGSVPDHPYIPLLADRSRRGPASAYTIASEIGDIGRFPSPKKLTGYTGFMSDRAPVGQPRLPWAARQRTAQSTCAGPSSKRLPTPLAMSAIGIATSATSTGSAASVAPRSPGSTIARQLAEAIWHVLTKNEPFAPAGPAITLVA